MTDVTDTPIIVNPSPKPEQLATQVRVLLIALGGIAVGRGWVSASEVSDAITVAGALLIVGPAVWAWVSAGRNKRKLVTAAEAAPDSVAQVKP